MGELLVQLSNGFNVYASFFSIYLVPIIRILGSAIPMGFIAGFYYKFNFKR